MAERTMAPIRQKILVANGDAPSRHAVAEILRGEGYEIFEAEDQEATLRQFTRARPDLVVLDVLMPSGTDGFQPAKRIRSLSAGARVPILLLIPPGDTEAIRQAFDAGVSDLVFKPVLPPLLIHRIHSLLRVEETLDELRRSQVGLEKAQVLAELGSWEWAPDLGLFTCAVRTLKLLGLPASRQTIGFNDLMGRVHPDDAPAVTAVLRNPQTGTQQGGVDFRILRQDGTVRHLHGEVDLVDGDAHIPKRVLGTFQDVTQRIDSEERIRYLALFDSLTGLPNRRQFLEQIRRAMSDAQRKKHLLAVMLMDLDNFKRINESLGHKAGDLLLQQVSRRIMDTIRGGDDVAREDGSENSCPVGRLVGDEFILKIGNLRRVEDAARVARRILDAFSCAFTVGQNQVFLTTGMGISLFPQDAQTEEELLRNAGIALSKAKRGGRNQFHFYSPGTNVVAFQRLSLEGSIRRAIENRQMILHFQPIMDTVNGRIAGAEALVRWRHPDLGLVLPSDFISVVEDVGLMKRLTLWVVEEALQQASRWCDAGMEALRVSINLSTSSFRDASLLQQINNSCRAIGFPPERVDLEITESVLMDHTAETIGMLSDLRGKGFRITVDDFGTGYSCLSYLKRLPIHALKIDQSFVRSITSDPTDVAITDAICHLAASLGLEVVGEGIEQDDQSRLLRDKGCRLQQGYLFSRPVPPEEFLEFARQHALPQTNQIQPAHGTLAALDVAHQDASRPTAR